jgi:putative hydrolase of the HAD superfamily
LTLDVGQTLLFPHPSLGDVYAEVAGAHDLEIDSEWAESTFQRAWRATQAEQVGLIYGRTHEDAVGFWARVVGRMFDEAPLPESVLRGFVLDLYDAFGHSPVWRVNGGLSPLLEGCASRGLRVGIVSNWDQRLRNLLDELGITPLADPVLISAELGVEKPDPAIFRPAVEAWGVSPGSILHVGDTWADDVEGARAAGLRAAWYNPAGTPRPEAADDGIIEIRELADLLSALDSE